MTHISQYQQITLPIGELRGCLKSTIYDEKYYSFEGIPYAQPPVDELRFKSPLPAKPWAGIRDCLEFNIKPIQINSTTREVEGSEDCLYLNVYTKRIRSNKSLPVLVWIYGGAFSTGDATKNRFSPDYFMKEDVVVVTFNYRLSSLGFLSVKDPELHIPGNAGLKDQVLALKWVKEYIQHFNGDPENITVFGGSAGGCSTHYLTATKQTKNLFHKAICMSGCMLNSWSNTPRSDYAYRLALQHGFKGDNIDRNVIDFLRKLEPKKLVRHDILTTEERRNGTAFAFAPCVEPYEGDDCVIPCDPKDMLKSAWGNNIPLIIGGTADEGLIMYPRFKIFPQAMNAFNNDPEAILPVEVRKQNRNNSVEKAEMLIKAHFGDKVPSEKCLKEFIDFHTLQGFWHGFHRSVLSRLCYAKAPTYLYRFAFDSSTFNHHRSKFCGNDLKSGVAHGDDLSYLWFGNHAWKLEISSKEYKVIENMIKLFTNFAKTANPNFDGNNNWKPITENEPDMGLNITDQLDFMIIPEKEKLMVWDSLYDGMQLF